MRDVRDWNKYVDMVGKTISKRPATAETLPHETLNGHEDAPANGHMPVTESHSAVLPPRKGRGPRKEELREELLARLLDPTLSLDEAARLLDVCPTTVRRYTNKGILPHERSGGNQRRFKLSSVLAFLEAQSRGREE